MYGCNHLRRESDSLYSLLFPSAETYQGMEQVKHLALAASDYAIECSIGIKLGYSESSTNVETGMPFNARTGVVHEIEEIQSRNRYRPGCAVCT
jgi:hypothetical protein